MSQEWCSITDYQEDPATLADKELPTLAKVWLAQKKNLDISEFMQRLKREWAIETGLIERLYTLDRDITEQMIEHGINGALIPHDTASDAERVVAMIGDQEEAIESIFTFVRGDRPLSTSYVNELHSLFTRNQSHIEARDPQGSMIRVPLIRGDYKIQPNNPSRPDGTIHVYCPPEQTAAEMERLIALHQDHTDVAPEVEAAWLHHRFTQIHPFQDGNGRLARALATLVFIKADWFPIVVHDSERGDYIQTLEKADAGDLRPLVAFFARRQRQEITRALGIAKETQQINHIQARIASIETRLAQRQDALQKEWGAATSGAKHLHRITKEAMEGVCMQLTDATKDYPGFKFFVDKATDQGERSHYFQRQIVSTAKALKYYANLRGYRSWVRLVARDGSQSNILVSFHIIGHEFRGILGCSATWFRRVPSGDNESEVEGDTPLCAEVFRINYEESKEDIEARFKDWLDTAIVRWLALWEKTTL